VSFVRHQFRAGFSTDQAIGWAGLPDRWKLIEASGYDSIWLADHLLPWWTDPATRARKPVPWDTPASDERDPYLEGWTLLSAAATLTERVQLGMLVTDNLLRHPVLTAKMAVTVDHISGGRTALGLGAGWMEREHTAYGFPFGTPGEKVDRLTEALAVIDALMQRERTSFDGQYVQIDNAPFEPKPVNGQMPFVVAGRGNRMLKLIARYADVWNTMLTPDGFRERGQRLNEECEKIGRDPSEIRWSCYGFGEVLGIDPFSSAGAFERVAEQFIEAGVSELLLEVPHPNTGYDDVIREIGLEVLPRLRAATG
jgi:alkanesulfonate monooxygenase SsuD/methylene tetrahydromethanopterin reductase-like flavin-dependent oxidoreductase (luciferase family)